MNRPSRPDRRLILWAIVATAVAGLGTVAATLADRQDRPPEPGTVRVRGTVSGVIEFEWRDDDWTRVRVRFSDRRPVEFWAQVPRHEPNVVWIWVGHRYEFVVRESDEHLVSMRDLDD